MNNLKWLGFDTETHKVTPGMLSPKMVCLTWADWTGRTGLLNRIDGLKWLRSALEDESVGLVGHRVTYDLAVAAAEDWSLIPLIFKAVEQGRITCTNIRQALLDIAIGELEYFIHPKTKQKTYNKLSLQQLVDRYFDTNIVKGKDSWQTRFHELDNVNIAYWPKTAADYALDDAVWALKVKDKQDIEAGEPIPTENEQVRANWALHLMAVWGLRSDPTRVFSLRDRLVNQRDKYYKLLNESGLIRPTGARNNVLIKELVTKAWAKKGKDPILTDKGNVCIDKDAVKAAVEGLSENDELYALSYLSNFVHVDKMLGTFLPPLIAGTQHPFNPNWNVLVSSGRTSCGSREGENESVGNLQNYPRDDEIRSCWTARPGTVFCSTDYDTAELRSLSQVCIEIVGHSVLGEEIRRGLDPHLAFAAQELLNIDYDKAKENKRDKEVKDARNFAKIFNFGAPGGMGPKGLVEYAKGYGIIMSEEQSSRIYKSWLKHYSEMSKYFKFIKGVVGPTNSAVYQDPVTKFVRGDVGFTQLSNHCFQHRTATGAKRALWEITKECYLKELESPLYGSRPVLFIHDEVVTEIPELGQETDAAKRQAELMCKAMDTVVSSVPNTCSPALMRYWYKAAEPVWENQILKVWEPK